jgi:hypothetical protein
VLLAITFFQKHMLAPATKKKSDGETGVLLANGEASVTFSTKNVKITDVLAECYGKKGCHHKMMAIGAF